jgi:hypothetical protein
MLPLMGDRYAAIALQRREIARYHFGDEASFEVFTGAD